MYSGRFFLHECKSEKIYTITYCNVLPYTHVHMFTCIHVLALVAVYLHLLSVTFIVASQISDISLAMKVGWQTVLRIEYLYSWQAGTV